MAEDDWITAADPQEMLRALDPPSERKLRLFAVRCCRQYYWDLLTDVRSRTAVEVSERFADGDATEEERQAAFRAGRAAAEWGSRSESWREAWAAAWVAALGPRTAVEAVMKGGPGEADLLRDIFGNPFRPLSPLDASLLAWSDGLVVNLAQAAYEYRSLPSGYLDNAHLAVLSDALEEAGSTDDWLLGHLRSEGPHVRGCWAVDAVLGRV